MGLHLLRHPQHPRVDVVGELLGIGQRDDDIGLMTRIALLASRFESVIHGHRVSQCDIAMGQTDVMTIARLVATHRPLLTIDLGTTAIMNTHEMDWRLGSTGTHVIDDDGSLAHQWFMLLRSF